jgi:hypothetical protein
VDLLVIPWSHQPQNRLRMDTKYQPTTSGRHYSSGNVPPNYRRPDVNHNSSAKPKPSALTAPKNSIIGW